MMDTLPFQSGVAALPMRGQQENADKCLIRPLDGGLLVAVVDGLGHGPEASQASSAAISVLEACPTLPLTALFQCCHERLVPTRGAAISMAILNALDATLTWAGVGNVEGRLLRGRPTSGPARESLLLLSGVVGGRLPPLRPASIPIFPGDILVMTTDGIRGSFEQSLRLTEPPQAIAASILARCRRETDDALVLVVRYTGGVLPSRH